MEDDKKELADCAEVLRPAMLAQDGDPSPGRQIVDQMGKSVKRGEEQIEVKSGGLKTA